MSTGANFAVRVRGSHELLSTHHTFSAAEERARRRAWDYSDGTYVLDTTHGLIYDGEAWWHRDELTPASEPAYARRYREESTQ